MGAIVKSIEISRRPEDVFSYATDFSRFPEWQAGVVSVRPQGDGPLAVGSRAIVTRRAGPRELARTEEITELRPPRTWTVRGVGGPVIATAKGTIEPLDLGSGPASRSPSGSRAAGSAGCSFRSSCAGRPDGTCRETLGG